MTFYGESDHLWRSDHEMIHIVLPVLFSRSFLH